MIKTEINGLKDMERALEQLAKEYGVKEGEKTLRQALRNSAKPVLNSAKEKVPQKTGKLKDSLKISVGKPNREDRKNGADSSTVAVARVKAGNTKKANQGGVYYTHMVEYGTKRSAPHPFIRPAIEAESHNSRSIFANELGKAIDKSAKRLQKKANKNKGGK